MKRVTVPPMGLGHDLCHIPRIYSILTSKRGPRFVERVLTQRERQKPRSQAVLGCVSRGLQTRSNSETPLLNKKAIRDPTFWKAAEYMAGRFAAKEAAIKAFHQQRLTFQNIEIVSNASGAGPRRPPGLSSSTVGAVAEEEQLGDESEPPVAAREDPRSSGPPTAIIRFEGSEETYNALLSITHDGDYASAVCIKYDNTSPAKRVSYIKIYCGCKSRLSSSPSAGERIVRPGDSNGGKVFEVDDIYDVVERDLPKWYSSRELGLSLTDAIEAERSGLYSIHRPKARGALTQLKAARLGEHEYVLRCAVDKVRQAHDGDALVAGQDGSALAWWKTVVITAAQEDSTEVAATFGTN